MRISNTLILTSFAPLCKAEQSERACICRIIRHNNNNNNFIKVTRYEVQKPVRQSLKRLVWLDRAVSGQNIFANNKIKKQIKKHVHLNKMTKSTHALFTHWLEAILLRIYVVGILKWIELQISEDLKSSGT